MYVSEEYSELRQELKNGLLIDPPRFCKKFQNLAPMALNASHTAVTHLETDVWEIPFADATTVLNVPVAKNCRATASCVAGAIGYERAVMQLRFVEILSSSSRNIY